ncbi:MAG: hypothetical protein HQL35_08205 [Alphaproteobacteria bacterium]|nr:hypothetical protein [Alphaproteobacteria bacterium]
MTIELTLDIIDNGSLRDVIYAIYGGEDGSSFEELSDIFGAATLGLGHVRSAVNLIGPDGTILHHVKVTADTPLSVRLPDDLRATLDALV